MSQFATDHLGGAAKIPVSSCRFQRNIQSHPQIDTEVESQYPSNTANRHIPISFPTLSLSYNGGKDCLVLLLLYLSLLHDHAHLPARLLSIYIPPPDPFTAQDAFVDLSSAHYHLSLARHSHPNMKHAFASYLSSAAGRKVRCIFVGTRRTDPHGGKLTPFDMTDHGWPSFMRCHPVLEWKYAEVWAFLRWMGVGYCALYDEGFTSLGGREDTRPNPVLAVVDDRGQVVGYKPAYELVEDWEERLGRD